MSFSLAFLKKGKYAKTLKEELLEAIAPLDRRADATLEDQQRIDQVGCLLFFVCFSFWFFIIWLLYSSLFSVCCAIDVSNTEPERRKYTNFDHEY